MTIEIFDMPQNSDEWFACKLGIASASEFKSILAKGEGKTRRSYMLRLLAERLTGEQGERYESAEMKRGHEMEDEARNIYAFLHEADPMPVGFIRNGDVGASPDSLLGGSGLLEIKTKRADLLLDVILKNEIPSEHVAQIQGQLWVSEREFVDLICYWPKIKPFVKRCHRNESYIKTLAEEVAKFNEELAELEHRLRSRAA